jgi:hypothetical protein
MNVEIRHPSIASLSHKLAALDATPAMAQAAIENPKLIPEVFAGFDELITCFNELTGRESVMAFMPATKRLRSHLGAYIIPHPQYLGARQTIQGIRKAIPLMEMGQNVKKGLIPATEANRKQAIGTPSMDTRPEALVIGTAAHLIERAMFEHFAPGGLTDWYKDDILHALVEVALLIYAQNEMSGTKASPRLLPYFISPHSHEPQGGLGWKTPQEVAEFVRRYKELRTWEQAQECESRINTGW